MSSGDAYARLLALDVPVIRTGEVAAALNSNTKAASMTLTRLAAAGLVQQLRKGLWIIKPQGQAIDRYSVVEALTAPFPSYVSLQTALYLHGMIEQVPAVIYAVTLGETARVRTSLGVYSFHHITPRLFDGFETRPTGTKVASQEKALFDMAYFSGSKVRLFSHVPELELPKQFKRRALKKWLGKVDATRRRSMVEERLERWIATATTA